MSSTIQFTDTSTNANTYFWDFGDGNTSTERNPIHTYQDDGEYVVTHTVTNDFGEASAQQTVNLSSEPGDEERLNDDTEPNPTNPPFGYNPSQGQFLAGTISSQGQWIWDGQVWNTLEPQPSSPPMGYNPSQGQFQVGALSSNEQWVWDGQVWNLNVGVDEEEPSPEETFEELSAYQVTLNGESEGNLDLINLSSGGTYTEGDEIEFIVFFVTGYDHSPSDVQLRPFITTPENLEIQLIEDNSFTFSTGQEGRNATYRFTMPSQDVEITVTAFLPETSDSDGDGNESTQISGIVQYAGETFTFPQTSVFVVEDFSDESILTSDTTVYITDNDGVVNNYTIGETAESISGALALNLTTNVGGVSGPFTLYNEYDFYIDTND